MAEISGNAIYHGKGGTAWFNGKLLTTLQSCEAKVTGDFEEFNVCDDPATYSLYNGWKGEGTLVRLKTDSEVLVLLDEAYQSGVMPELTIITRITQKSTGKVERIKLTGVTITEFYLAKFEKKAMVEEEIPFKFSGFEVMETIDE